MTEHTVSELCIRSHEISKSKGWLDDPRPFHTLCLLMHSEVSEALEDYRNNKGIGEIYYECKLANGQKVILAADQKLAPEVEVLEKKPCGIPIEMADVVIRIAQWAGTAGIAHKFEEEFGHMERSSKLLSDDIEETLAWVHVDISMATRNEWEAAMRSSNTAPVEPADHSHSVTVHLAQAAWRLFALCKLHKVDLWAAIDEKEAFNKTRPHRHGGKKI